MLIALRKQKQDVTIHLPASKDISSDYPLPTRRRRIRFIRKNYDNMFFWTQLTLII